MRDERARIVILSPGVAQIVDEGRFGHGQQGIPEAMPLDVYAARSAFAMLPGAVGVRPWWIEIGLTSFALMTDKPLWIGLAGAARAVTAGGHVLAGGRALSLARLRLSPGDTLSLSAAYTGFSSYVAVAAAWADPLVLGSASALCGVGVPGVSGRRLGFSDELQVCPVEYPGDEQRRVQRVYEAAAALTVSDKRHDTTELRYTPGPEHAKIVAALGLPREGFCARVSSQYDRRGIRLQPDDKLDAVWGAMLSSSPTTFGLIQWPPGGEPIILGPERQTVGGYPRFGSLITADRMRLGALRPGQHVTLRCVDQGEALRAYDSLMRQWNDLQIRLRISDETEGQHGSWH